jgi:hypothetical protein
MFEVPRWIKYRGIDSDDFEEQKFGSDDQGNDRCQPSSDIPALCT